MNNQELEQKILELLKETNYFDFLIAVKNFEKEYKESDFLIFCIKSTCNLFQNLINFIQT